MDDHALVAFGKFRNAFAYPTTDPFHSAVVNKITKDAFYICRCEETRDNNPRRFSISNAYQLYIELLYTLQRLQCYTLSANGRRQRVAQNKSHTEHAVTAVYAVLTMQSSKLPECCTSAKKSIPEPQDSTNKCNHIYF
jgi:hypothetical protein